MTIDLFESHIITQIVRDSSSHTGESFPSTDLNNRSQETAYITPGFRHSNAVLRFYVFTIHFFSVLVFKFSTKRSTISEIPSLFVSVLYTVVLMMTYT